MNSKIFSSLEIDAIGEILNISLGASATAVSTMLSKRVDITTPKVQVLSFDEFEFGALEPAIGVEITYVSGLSGSNIMLLKRHDVKVIVEMLMGMEIPEEEFELNEMNLSAICEVMNQMMGASSTALSEFLGELVNISTPVSFEIVDVELFKKKYFAENDQMVVVSFILKIEDVMESEFLNVMPVHLAKRLVAAFGLDISEMDDSNIQPQPETSSTNEGSTMMSQDEIEAMLGQVTQTPEPQSDSSKMMSQDEIEKLLMGNTQSEPVPAASTKPMSQDEIEKLLAGTASQQQAPPPQAQQPQMVPQPQMAMQPQMVPQPQMMPQQMYSQPQMVMQPQMMPQQMYSQPEPKIINVQPMIHNPLDTAVAQLGEEQAENLSLIMEVPLEVSVEIGRTRKLVKDILELNNGSLVVLDKLAGEQVDLYVNGQCIAKGDVVVVDDNFGVRITEIIKKPDLKIGTKS